MHQRTLCQSVSHTVAAASVTVPIRGGKAGEETSLIVAEGAEGDIDVGGGLTEEGEDRRHA